MKNLTNKQYANNIIQDYKDGYNRGCIHADRFFHMEGILFERGYDIKYVGEGPEADLIFVEITREGTINLKPSPLYYTEGV